MSGVWIRSQSGALVFTTRLVPVGNEVRSLYPCPEDCDLLGRYPTAARALEVLDEIAVFVDDVSNPTSGINTRIFRMPKE